MSLLETITKPGNRAIIATICGDSGMGKTSLAATFDRPIFIRAEDGLQAIPDADRPDAFPMVQNEVDLIEQIKTLYVEEHDYKTLVIDSITALERMFVTEVVADDPKAKSINQAGGGYGAGWARVGAKHQRLRRGAGRLNDRGMNVVFIAHADVETIKSPELDDYMRWTLRLNPKNSIAPYVDDVDLVGFLRLQTFVRASEGERGKAISTGARELVCHATAANVSKNRFGITEALPVEMGVNPLAGIVPCIKKGTEQ